MSSLTLALSLFTLITRMLSFIHSAVRPVSDNIAFIRIWPSKQVCAQLCAIGRVRRLFVAMLFGECSGSYTR